MEVRPPMSPPIQIPLTLDPPYTLSAWCATGPTLPTPEILQRAYFDWLARHCDDPFRTSLQEWTEKGRLDIRVFPVGTIEPPPLQALRQGGSTEVEEGRLARASHEIVITGRDRAEPRLALWNVLGMARSTALQYAGVVMDRDVPRLVPIDHYTRRLKPGVRIADYVQILAVPQREGRAHLVARGLRKFQLPQIEVQYVARDLQPQMALAVQVLAQILVHRARKALAGGQTTLAIPAEQRLDLEHDALRRIAWKVDSLPNARRATTVRLAYVPGPDAHTEPSLRIEPPPGWKGDPRGWMAPMLTELVGGEVPLHPETAETAEPSDPMEAAHHKALEELPELRRRYQKGLPSGHDVYVKRGFPLPDGGREYMWIHVTGWFDGMVRGRLATHPRYRTDLHAGQALQCAEEDVYDWLLIFPDGREMGGYTDQVPQARRVPRPIPF
jgi:uncharacterized protein YegJ (DUF2314 family)